MTLEEYVHYTIYTLEYRSMILEQLSEDRERLSVSRLNSRSNFTPEVSQLNQDFHPRYKLGLTLPRKCHNLTRISTPSGEDTEPTGVTVQTCVIRDLG